MAAFLEEQQHAHHNDNAENSQETRRRWYFSRKDIEANSPSRRDGIDLKKENFLRKSYCTFLQDLGKTLKVPQLTIATAIIFCHRFFLRQSHAKNDRRIIATVCMFLAGKVEESFRPLRDVVIVSYRIIYKKDAAAVQRIKQKEVYEQQKELILLGENIVLTTLDFDLNIHHPYKPLVVVIRKYEVVEEKKNTLAQVAWNFVNDGLRTSLSLQFKPHQIAAGAIFLAARFLNVELTTSERGEKSWWQEFDGVTQHQLADISNQMMELYELQKGPPLQLRETSGITDCEGSMVIDTCHLHEREAMPKGEASVRNEVMTTIVSVVKNKSEDAVKKLDVEKLRSNFERRKSCGKVNRETNDPLDEIERELEDVEVPGGNKSITGEKKQSEKIVSMDVGDDEFGSVDIEEEIEVSDDVNDNDQSPLFSRTRKRKAE